MEPVITASLPLGCGVGDIFVMRLPFHLIAHPLHTGDKTGLGAALLHGLINGAHQPEFEAAAPCRRPVFARAHGVLSWLTIRLQGFQSVCLTDLVGQGAKLLQTFFVELQFQAGFTAYRIDHKVIVPMVAVYMGSDLYLVTFKIFRKFQAHLVDFLRSDRSSRFERLHILIEIHALFLPVAAFGCHKFLKGGIPAAVLSGYQLDGVSLFIFEYSLFVLRHIPHNLGHGGFALRSFFHSIDDSHGISPCPSKHTGNQRLLRNPS